MLGLLRANHFVNSHEQGVRTKGRAGRATVEQLAPGSARSRGGQKLVALVVRTRGLYFTPLETSMRRSLAICPENDSPFYGFIRSGLNYEHHVRITYTMSNLCALLNNMVT